MSKIKGWKKKVDTINRQYWENKERQMIANVERINKKWYFTKGRIKSKQSSDSFLTKKMAMKRAIGYMKFHSEVSE